MYLNEAIVIEILSKQLAHPGREPENSLFSRCSEIQYPIVKSIFHRNSEFELLIFTLYLFLLELVSNNFSRSILELNREFISRSIHHKEFQNLKLDLLSTTLNWFFRNHNSSDNINNTFTWCCRDIFDHLFGCCLGFEDNSLKG